MESLPNTLLGLQNNWAWLGLCWAVTTFKSTYPPPPPPQLKKYNKIRQPNIKNKDDLPQRMT